MQSSTILPTHGKINVTNTCRSRPQFMYRKGEKQREMKTSCSEVEINLLWLGTKKLPEKKKKTILKENVEKVGGSDVKGRGKACQGLEIYKVGIS